MMISPLAPVTVRQENGVTESLLLMVDVILLYFDLPQHLARNGLACTFVSIQ